MDKKQMILAGFAIFTVGLFLLESFSLGFFRTGVNPFQGGGADPGTQVVTTERGIAEFDAVLNYYESYLISNESLTAEKINKIKENNMVLDVTNSQQGYIVEVKNKEDVPNVYTYLKENNVSAKGVANFVLPSNIEVKLADGRVIETSGNEGILIRLDLEPTIQPGSKVKMQMIAQVQGQAITGYAQAGLAPTFISINGTATITELANSNVKATVPWEERDKIDVLKLEKDHGNNSVVYTRRDSIVIMPNLNLDQMKEKKKLTYITFISENSAAINKSFNDKETITKDFEGFNVTFPDSILTISTNKPVELPYRSETTYTYKLRINEIENYTLDHNDIELVFDKKHEIGENISISLDAEVVSGAIKNILSIRLTNSS